MEKLPKEFKEKWIAALRSGKYKQAKYQLHLGKGYCCLGVACRIAGFSDEEMGDYCFPSTVAIQRPGVMPDFFRNTTLNTPSWTLTVMNDTEGKSFSEIADWIESNL